MSRLVWGDQRDRIFEAGVDRGVIFPAVGPGVVWGGLVSVNETTDDSAQTVLYIDGERKISHLDLSTFSATVTAITYPEAFEMYDGYDDILSGQNRPRFGFSYRTLVGDTIQGIDLGYIIHLVYNSIADPTNSSHEALNPSLSLTQFEWDLTTTPINISGFRSTSHVLIDSRTTHPTVLATIEGWLYGTDETTPRLPSIAEIIEAFDEYAIFIVTPHGDGAVTISGSDEAVYSLGHDNLWEINFLTVEQIAEHAYFARSY